jgi:hypothetical protein
VSGRHARAARAPSRAYLMAVAARRLTRRACVTVIAARGQAGRIAHRAYVAALLAGLAVTGGWVLYVMARPFGRPW